MPNWCVVWKITCNWFSGRLFEKKNSYKVHTNLLKDILQNFWKVDRFVIKNAQTLISGTCSITIFYSHYLFLEFWLDIFSGYVPKNHFLLEIFQNLCVCINSCIETCFCQKWPDDFTPTCYIWIRVYHQYNSYIFS